MIMKIKLDEGAKMPTRAHRWDAGLDLYAMEGVIIPSGHRANLSTGIHVQIPAGFTGLIRSRSGLMSKIGITTDGTIDCGYTGPIKVTLLNHDWTPYHVKAGDKIAQLVIVPCGLPELELVDELEETERGDGGFGSTGR